MKACASLLFIISWLLVPWSAVTADNLFAPEDFLFDRYGRISWDEEKARLDNFAIKLKSEPELIGYIYVQVAQISCTGEALSHAIGRTKYLVQDQHVQWNQVAWRDLGYGESFEVSLWLFPAGQPPQYVPKYKPETGSTYVEDCGMMRLQRRQKHRTFHRAANNGLQRTRR